MVNAASEANPGNPLAALPRMTTGGLNIFKSRSFHVFNFFGEKENLQTCHTQKKGILCS